MKIPAGAALGLFLMTPATLLAADEGGGGLFTVDPGLAVWTIATFLVVLFILGKFAWGPILGALDAREKGIRESIDEAARMRQEARAALEEHKRQLADARRQAQEIVAEGRDAADRLRRDIEAKAREEGERILERTRQEVRRERDLAVEQIRTEAVDLALAAASRILDEKLTEERDRALVRSYLQDIRPPAAEA
jgi:F-type H+-transporting ATPase subunit b